MYTLERLLRDATARIAALQSRSVDLTEVWEAFNKYLGQVIEKRQTLQVLNTLTVGWKFLEAGPGGASRLLPTFHLSEAYAANTGVNTRRHPVVPERILTSREEFNCSKAAIRFSQSLTKDQVFMGLRAILHQLGEAMASGQPCSIDFEVGKLLCTERHIQFVFAADVYLREGLKVPEESEGVEYKPSVTFGLPSQEAMTLRLDGRAAPLAQTPNVQAMTMGGWAEPGEGDREEYPAGAGSVGDCDSECSTGDVYVPEASYDPPEDMRAEDWRATEQRQELVYRDAIERRMDDAIREAAEADGDRESWEDHLRRCVEEDQRELEWRKAIELDHQSRLLGQMQEDEVKRLQDRQFRLEQASLHEFPDFTKYVEQPTYEYMHRMRGQLKNALADQIEQKEIRDAQDRQMERDLDVAHLQQNRQIQTEESNQAMRKKEKMALAMTENWALNLQFKEAQKAIDDHHKAPSKAKLNTTMTALAGSSLGPATPRSPLALSPTAAWRQQAAPRQATPRLQPQATPRQQRPATPGQPQGTRQFQMESPPSSRPVTGSARRMPLGAAGSLALHKKKMAASLRPKDYTKLQSGSLS